MIKKAGKMIFFQFILLKMKKKK